MVKIGIVGARGLSSILAIKEIPDAEVVALCDLDKDVICHGGIPIATATAWLYDKSPDSTGYVHMVGAMPEWKGRGLGYQVSLAALHEMKREGKKDAVLHTDDFRLAAVKIYLSLGFEPEMNHESHESRWEQVYQKLK